MPSAFLVQFAAGCYLAIAISDIHRSGWRYLRLMAIVAIALAFGGAMMSLNAEGWSVDALAQPATLFLGGGLLLGIVWLFVNAAQQEKVTNAQRLWPALAGAACLVAAVFLTLGPDALLGAAPAHGRGDDAPTLADANTMAGTGGATTTTTSIVAPTINTILGALLLGSLTSAMLLGHRYLTDTQMPIAPLRRLTIIYLCVFALRATWSVANVLPVWLTDFRPHESPMFFQIALIARLGIGLAAVAIFAYMVWDCVKRRATQSATAMFYLSMVPVFIGELAGQFLMRTEGLAV